jgi:nucleotide-binding universal stress UspA family protein
MKNTTPPPIICGTDFSENARQTGSVAATLATRLSAPLVLVNATGLLIQGSTPEAYEAVGASFRNRLNEEAERLRELGATVEEILSPGAPDEVLVQLAEQRQARLLVVSSLGLRAPTHWLLGSVAERLSESSPVPTLVVRDAAPFEAWARGDRPLNVFVGVDFTANSDAALRWIAELRQIGLCEVVAAYADWPPEETARLGVSRSFGLLENPPGMQRVLERDMQEKVARFLGKEPVRILVQGGWGRVDAQLIELAAEAQADLIVVGTHQWHGLSRLRHGSVSRGILYHSPTSVACVPTPTAPPIAGPRVRECRRVLAAADLDASHGFAAPYAYSIVNPGGTVRLVHVVEPFQSTNPLIGRHYQDLPTRKEHAQQVAASEARLRALAPTEAEARGIKTEVEVLENLDKAKAICAAAERFDADVVCIGGHTRPGFTAKILGSVAFGVLTQCRRPVLIVWPSVIL